ncbi:tetratricopeptide repeat protein [bacterium]|nr:tetratricopeptide repeat protein [bacterium]
MPRTPVAIARRVAIGLLLVMATSAVAVPEDDDDALVAIDALLERGDAAAALRRVETLLESGSLERRNLWRARQRLGAALVAVGRPDEAVAPLEAAIREVPDDPTLHLTLGRALRDLGQRGRAVAEFQDALALGGVEPLWRLEYAALLRELGAAAEAAREIARARQDCDGCTAALEAAADLHLARGDHAAAVGPLRELFGRGARPELRARLLAALWNVGDAAGVASVVDTMATETLTGDELMIVAQADRALGAAGRACDWAHEPPVGLPDGWRPPARFWALTAEICLGAGQATAALTAIDRALALDDSVAIHHHNRAAVLLELGREREARAALAVARRLDPNLGDRP